MNHLSPRRPRHLWLAGTLLVAALIGAACGGDDDDTPSGGGAPDTTGATTATTASGTGAATTAASPTTAADVDPDGVLKISTGLAVIPGGAQLDPADTTINSDEPWMFLLYGTLLRESAQGVLEPWLAESADVVDGSTIKVKLREGVKFSDGTAYDAAAVRRGILRNLNEPGLPGVPAGRNFVFVELADIVVDGPLEMTFMLKRPVAGEFLQVLAGRESAVPSSKSLDDGGDPSKTPVGAGPYMLDDFREGQLVSLRKSPTFIDADKWRLGGVDFVDAAVGAPTVNALLSNAVDIGQISLTDQATFKSNADFDVTLVHRDFDYQVFNFCRTKEPFTDIRVRQAFQMAIDREALNQGLTGGDGQVAYGFWPEDSPYFDEALKPYAEYNPEEAKRLLAEAGTPEVTFDLVQANAGGGQNARLSEIVQAQLAEVGIKANLVFTPNVVTEFIQPQKPGVLMVPGSRPGVDRVAKLFQKGFQQALCGSSDEEIMAAANEIASLSPDDPKVAELYAQVEERNAENAFVLFLVKIPLAYTWNTERIGGEPQFSGQKGLVRFDAVYIRS